MVMTANIICKGAVVLINENKDKLRLLFIISYFVFAAGSIAGSIYYVNCAGALGDIKNSWNLYVNSIKNGLELNAVIKNALKNNLILLCVLFVSAFFRAGIALSGFYIARKGFVTGFTAASIVNIYGIKGISLILISVLQYIIIIPITLLIFSMNSLVSLRIIRTDKKTVIFYILFFILATTIFCVEAALEGLYSTTFMKWLLNMVT